MTSFSASVLRHTASRQQSTWQQSYLSMSKLNKAQVFCQESKANCHNLSLWGKGSCSQSLEWLKLSCQRWEAVSSALRGELRKQYPRQKICCQGWACRVLGPACYLSAWCNGVMVLFQQRGSRVTCGGHLVAEPESREALHLSGRMDRCFSKAC